jgi:hypothetical protein
VGLDVTDTYIDTECEEIDDTFPHSVEIAGTLYWNKSTIAEFWKQEKARFKMKLR